MTYPFRAFADRTFVFAVLLLMITAMMGMSATAADLPDGMEVTDVKVGDGEEAQSHMRAVVHYTGWTADGQKFDSSRDRGQPFTFAIDSRSVIPGWDIGVKGMRVGGVRKLTIPPELAYGKRGFPPKIPPNATLTFEIELLGLEGPSYSNVDNDELKALMEKGVPVVDIRRRDEWQETGVLKGARLITAFDERGRLVPSFVSKFQAAVKPGEPVALICRTGSRTSVIAQALADRLGYEKVYNVEDGITHWIEQGNAVVAPGQNPGASTGGGAS